MREKYCIRDCKGLKPLAREPQTQKEFYCEECALEFGVIPGACVCVYVCMYTHTYTHNARDQATALSY